MTINLFDALRQDTFGDPAGPGLGAPNFNNDTLQIALIDSATIAPDISAHQTWADLVGALVGTRVTLTNAVYVVQSNLGNLDADTATIPAVSGASITDMVLLKWSGVNSTSQLIMHWESGDVTNMPFAPNGGDIDIRWDVTDGIMSW